MKTEIWDMRDYQKSPLDYPELENIKQVYNDGGLIAIPTETVYGLVQMLETNMQFQTYIKLKDVLLTIH